MTLDVEPASVTLSRLVTQEELSRDSSRIDGMGLCGYLSLEWASRGGVGCGVGLNLRVPSQAARLESFIGSLVVGCRRPATALKCAKVQALLRESATPWHSPCSDGLWLDVSDLAHMSIRFPVVLWGSDVGGGLHRVIYPPVANHPMAVGLAIEISGTTCQIILDSDHFHPLDLTGDAGLLRDPVLAGGVVAVVNPSGQPPVTLLGSPCTKRSGTCAQNGKQKSSRRQAHSPNPGDRAGAASDEDTSSEEDAKGRGPGTTRGDVLLLADVDLKAGPQDRDSWSGRGDVLLMADVDLKMESEEGAPGPERASSPGRRRSREDAGGLDGREKIRRISDRSSAAAAPD